MPGSGAELLILWVREWYLATLKEWTEDWAKEQGFTVFLEKDNEVVKQFKNVDIYERSVNRYLFCYEPKKGYSVLLTWNAPIAGGPEYYIITFDLPIPQGTLFLRRENLADKAEAAMGKNDLDFEDKKFSDLFFVDAKPEKFAYRFFHPRMMELFLEEKDKKYDLYIHNGKVFLIRRHEVSLFPNIFRLIFRKKTIPKFHEEGMEFAEKMTKKIPRYMKDKEAIPVEDAVAVGGSFILECPKCSEEFKVQKGEKRIKCPHCGVEGSL